MGHPKDTKDKAWDTHKLIMWMSCTFHYVWMSCTFPFPLYFPDVLYFPLYFPFCTFSFYGTWEPG